MRSRFLAPTLALALAVALAGAGWPAPPAGAASPAATTREAPAADLPDISARSAVVVDDATGQVVLARNPHARRAPASITKIATALVALRHDSPSRVVTVQVDWFDLDDSTIMGLRRGGRLSIEDLLHGLMLPSGNDAAVALARAVAGSELAYVELMNAEVRRLGLRDTHFANPHGLDQEGHYTSAYDIVALAREAMRDPTFARIVRTREAEVEGLEGSYFYLRNLNRFLWRYPGADGVKNGYTDDAGQTVVGTAVRAGRRAYVAVMGSWDYATDAAALLDAYYAAPVPPAPAGAPLASLGVALPSGGERPADADAAAGAAELPHQWIDVPPSRSGNVRQRFRAQ